MLQEVEVPVINNTACEAMYQAAGYNEHIPNIFICAGLRRVGADSCEGKSYYEFRSHKNLELTFNLACVLFFFHKIEVR